MEYYLSEKLLDKYITHLRCEERALATVQKYRRDIGRFYDFCAERAVTKELVIQFKEFLIREYKATSANSILVAVNGFLRYNGWHSCCVKLVKIQRSMYRDGRRELTKEEYYRLLRSAGQKKDKRLVLLLQTLCSVGLRVGELKAITYRAVCSGRAEIRNKGKTRMVFLPKQLCAKLTRYCREKGITEGPVFISRYGNPLDRSNIWSMMKALCRDAGVDSEKVFPHNLRHLFASCFYRVQKDLEHLAAILGHSSIETTRIYTRTSGEEHQRQIETLALIL